MYYTLNQSDKERIGTISETGIGYQIVQIDRNFINTKYLVINNEYALEWNEFFDESPFYPLTIEQLLAGDVNGGDFNIGIQAAITLLPNPLSLPLTPTGAFVLPNFPYTTKYGDIFYRVSAFASDHCILNATDFRPQSYATTENDLKEVPSGLAAVSRYALPSRLPHIYVWKLEPLIGTKIYVGTVIPNFGMSGGGVEAYFPSGFTGGVITSINNLDVM